MDDVLAALASQIQTASGLSVAVGRPESAGAQLVLWPWHIVWAKTMRNNQITTGSPAPEPPMALSFILLAQGNLNELLRGSRCISQHAVFAIDGLQYIVKDQDLSQELHIALLHAAGIPPQPAMSYVLVG